jgi:phosphatidylinositol-binding clathrin assembly protein
MTGYKAPQNLQAYSLYLDSRIRGYRELKHDAIRVQSETNRDLRLSIAIQGDGPLSRNGNKSSISSASDMSRSKNPMSKKLRVLTVEKGLLKETKAVQKMIDTLVECRVGVAPAMQSDASLIDTH